MKHQHLLLTRQQWTGVVVLLLLLSLIFVGLHFLPSPPPAPITSTDSVENTIIHRKKQHYDSLRQMRWARYDSLRHIRRDSLHQLYTAHYDSVHVADSLWWDSVYSTRPRILKRDTILELNSADTTELKLIRGIGSSLARRIVRYRDQLGGYTSVEQLLDDQLYQDAYGHSMKNKYCIADSTLNCFTVDTDSVKTIPVNRSSIERLQAHPYISHALAKEIYTLRRQRVALKSIDEIRDLPHINAKQLQQLAPYLSFEQNK